MKNEATETVSEQKLGRWPGEQERQQLADAVRGLSDIASRDCYGWYGDSDEDPCKCEVCICGRAVEALQSVLYPVVRSLTPNRLRTGYRELLFFEAWKETNVRHRGLNGGRGTLEILTEELGPVTQRDMDVATAVVQWLGTSCGSGFLSEVEGHIERVRNEGCEKIHRRLRRVHGEPNEIGCTMPVVQEDEQEPAD